MSSQWWPYRGYLGTNHKDPDFGKCLRRGICFATLKTCANTIWIVRLETSIPDEGRRNEVETDPQDAAIKFFWESQNIRVGCLQDGILTVESHNPLCLSAKMTFWRLKHCSKEKRVFFFWKNDVLPQFLELWDLGWFRQSYSVASAREDIANVVQISSASAGNVAPRWCECEHERS